MSKKNLKLQSCKKTWLTRLTLTFCDSRIFLVRKITILTDSQPEATETGSQTMQNHRQCLPKTTGSGSYNYWFDYYMAIYCLYRNDFSIGLLSIHTNFIRRHRICFHIKTTWRYSKIKLKPHKILQINLGQTKNKFGREWTIKGLKTLYACMLHMSEQSLSDS